MLPDIGSAFGGWRKFPSGTAVVQALVPDKVPRALLP